ncbi:hypothetical protein HGP17_32295 [Rhizobium sp. P38BS-XIX]|uniref:hypothetical protein n=1 Tax=Rhizobium sp. P38BS-XIX TaxID=2726740 RepID=UPI0014577261|nr:hypothetical protein [Rhizobium sp. P38BS-XIX]NLS01539.1 hypothetical protein [Rhizobium sp. P38BS-XIX]
MPLQNRVTPFGDIVSISQRGLFTGNRGIIHDPKTKTLLTRRWSSKAWLVCECEYKGRRREVMANRSWTELFFLDEAVAFAAGHRPCFYCRRGAAKAFRACWATGKHMAVPSAATMDAELHAERLDHGRKRLHRLSTPLHQLPDGVMVAAGDAAYMLRGGLAYRWIEVGYAPPRHLKTADWLITPPSIVLAMRAGYHLRLHASSDLSS